MAGYKALALSIASLVIVYIHIVSRGAQYGLFRNLIAPYKDVFPNKFRTIEMQQLSRRVYKIENDSDLKATQETLNKLLPFKVKAHFFYAGPRSNECMIVSSKRENYVALVFRGSDESGDWLNNVDFMLEDLSFDDVSEDFKVHRGFREALIEEIWDNVPAYKKIEGELMNILSDANLNQDREVYLTGHSRGGAFAQIMGAYLAHMHPEVKFRLITFGQPRVGDNAFKQWVETKENFSQWRVVNRKDLVPRALPNTLGFRHAGHLVQVERDETLFYYEQDGDDPKYAGAPSTWSYGYSIRQHLNKAYYKAMNKIVEGNDKKFWTMAFELKRSKPCPWYNPFC